VSSFEEKVTIWLEEREPGFFKRLWLSFLFYRHNKWLREISWLKTMSWFIRFVASATAPAIAHFVYARISLPEALIATALLFVVFSANTIFEVWAKRKSSVVEVASAELWVRVGDLINSVKSSATPASDRDGSITATLSVIEGYARVVTGSSKGEISVSLALYDGRSTSSMKIKHRNSGNERPIGRGVRNLQRVFGHIACQSGLGPRVVHDLKSFGKEALFSPTQSSRNYRAILVIPIASSKTERIKGFVSIDCARPYAFFGNRSDRLVVTVEPLIDHIQEQC